MSPEAYFLEWSVIFSVFLWLHNLFYQYFIICSFTPMFSRSSLSCFFPPALFIISVSLALIFPFLTVAVSCLSQALQAWLYPNPRGNYCENISGYLRLSGYAPYQFLQLVCLKSWMKNDNTPVLTYKKQVGEGYSQAIRKLTQVLNASAGLNSFFLFLISVIKSLNQA